MNMQDMYTREKVNKIHIDEIRQHVKKCRSGTGKSANVENITPGGGQLKVQVMRTITSLLKVLIPHRRHGSSSHLIRR